MAEARVGSQQGQPGHQSRVVLVTGGSRGIGLACARLFQRGGDRVAVTYRHEAPKAEAPNGCKSANGLHELLALRCDVTEPEEVDKAFELIEQQLGPVQVLVANAGVTDDSLILRMSEETWARVLDTNLTGSFRVAKRAARSMVRGRAGRIILISSVTAFAGLPGQANYAASKAGLVGLGRSLARELASRSVTVNVVAPGAVATEMLNAIGGKRIAEMAAMIPLGRIATPDEVAAAVSFLASPQAGYITGAVLPVDGGLAMGL